ncbi:RloB family protein [Mucilaginibacter sp. P25]|uniref:RloB family protein n=1 Tax=Mucilaginibacter sp. P25 TaxID=3423945 RepID=UPI003D7AB419
MSRKINRGYKKGLPFRDYRKFIIICEGEREDDYFKEFNNINRRIQIHVVERDKGKSAVKYLLNRAANYDEQYGIELEDFLWFVLDVDRWPKEQINELFQNCEQKQNWFIAISNPCFEVWLHYHILKLIPAELDSPAKLKNNLSKIIQGGYNVKKVYALIENAILNSKAVDRNEDYYFPEIFVTKIYKLGEMMVAFLGNNWK